jgi:hypothetical protein
MAGRTIWAGLHLLDRQMLCRGEHMAGCVDDLELTPSDDGGRLYVTAIVSGPGALLYRLNRRHIGRWLQAAANRIQEGNQDWLSIPFGRVAEIESHVLIDVDPGDIPTAPTERWVRDHIISHIPGSRNAAK